MRVDAVVEAPLVLDHHPGLCHAEEYLLVEAFVPDLNLDGLTELSDAAAESLSKHKGEINFEDPKEWVESLRGGKE